LSERAKSILLASLVLLSLFLTYQLWFVQKPLEVLTEDSYEPNYFEEARSLTGIVTPCRVVLLWGGTFYQFRYGQKAFTTLWNAVSGLLQRIPAPELSRMEDAPFTDPPVLALSFQPPLPSGQGSVWLKNDVQRELKEVMLITNGEHWRLKFNTTAGETFEGPISDIEALQIQKTLESLDLSEAIPQRELNSEELSAALGLNIEVAAPIYVPDRPVHLEELVFKEEELDRELLVRTFFVDRSLVRVVTERDGSLIYTDGEKGLRLGSGLTYSHPQLEQSPATYTYLAALNSASRLLGYYGGWAEHLRLESLLLQRKTGQLSEHYLACWQSYYQGKPIMGDIVIKMTFNDSGMVEYQRRLYEVAYSTGNTYAVPGYLEALLAALDLLREENTDYRETTQPLILEEMMLGYALKQETLRALPVWLIRINGLNLEIDASGVESPKGVSP